MNSVVLVDTSSSMCEPVGSRVRRRIDVLRDILEAVLPVTPAARLIAFDSIVREIDGAAALPEPSGGTMLHNALDFIAPLHPQQLILISDGEPQDAEAALTAARKLHCVIRTYFCGDERNHAAIAFLRALSWRSSDGFGQAVVSDLRKPEKLAGALRLALTAPGR